MVHSFRLPLILCRAAFRLRRDRPGDDIHALCGFVQTRSNGMGAISENLALDANLDERLSEESRRHTGFQHPVRLGAKSAPRIIEGSKEPRVDWQGLESFSFGDNPTLADELAELVLVGKKTATCWAACEGLLTEIGKRMVIARWRRPFARRD
jgi:hypothetical protein